MAPARDIRAPLGTCYSVNIYQHAIKLWTDTCEMRQIFKWDLIKFREIFIKITLKLPQNSQKPLL